MKYNYYKEDVGNGDQWWFIWEHPAKGVVWRRDCEGLPKVKTDETVTLCSYHGCLALAYTFQRFGFKRDEKLNA